MKERYPIHSIGSAFVANLSLSANFNPPDTIRRVFVCKSHSADAGWLINPDTSSMNKTHYYLLLQRLGLVWLLYVLCRVIFCLINWGQYGEATLPELAGAFLRGFLFDTSAILLINAPVIVLSILPFRFLNNRHYQSFLALFFQLINIPFLVLNVVNAGYFRMVGKRITPAEGPELGTATADQVRLLVAEYWYVSLLGLLISLLLVWYNPAHYRLDTRKRFPAMWGWLAVFLSLAISFLVFAFTLKTHPLSPDTVTATRESHLDNLSRNAAFNLLSRFFDQAIKKID